MTGSGHSNASGTGEKKLGQESETHRRLLWRERVKMGESWGREKLGRSRRVSGGDGRSASKRTSFFS